MITLQSVSKSFAHKEGTTKAVRNLSLDIPQGMCIGLIGPNGAGKSTTIKMVLGLIKPDNGSIQSIGTEYIGYVPETPALYKYLTAPEILKMYMQLQGLSPTANQIKKILKTVGLQDVGTKRVNTFSKGMAQRLAIAQAIAHKPKVLIVDEPFSGLDPIGRNDIKSLLQQQKEQGVTIIICSHILAEIAQLAEHIAIMDRGSILKEGSKKKLGINTDTIEQVFMKTIQKKK